MAKDSDAREPAPEASDPQDPPAAPPAPAAEAAPEPPAARQAEAAFEAAFGLVGAPAPAEPPAEAKAEAEQPLAEEPKAEEPKAAAKASAEESKPAPSAEEIERLLAAREAARQAEAQRKQREQELQQRLKEEYGDEEEFQRRMLGAARGTLSYEEQDEYARWVENRRRYQLHEQLVLQRLSGVLAQTLASQGADAEAIRRLQAAETPQQLFSDYWQTAYQAGAAARERELGAKLKAAEERAAALEADNRALRARAVAAAPRLPLGGRSAGAVPATATWDPRRSAEANFEAAFSTPPADRRS